MRGALIAQAEIMKKDYPQYRGHWDSWGVCQAKKMVKGKGGVILEKGRFYLLSPEHHMGYKRGAYGNGLPPDVPMRTVFSPSICGGLDSSVRASDILIVEERG